VDILLWVAAVAAPSGAALVSSLVSSSKVKHKVKWRRQTNAEKLMEQKELSRLLVMEVTRLGKYETVTKDQVGELLQQLEVLYNTSTLRTISNMKIKECFTAASIAMQIADKIDRLYMKLLTQMVEAIVSAVLRASSEKESIHMSLRTINELSLIAPGFRRYSGGAAQINEWKNEILNKDRKDMK
jgi:hypothetical protein